MFSMENNSSRSLPVKSYRQIRLNTKFLIGLFFFFSHSKKSIVYLISVCVYIYIWNYLDGSHKSQQHHNHPPQPHYSSFYPDIVVQPTNEPVDLAAAVEFDKERQTIEESLSKLSPPIVMFF
jgi:hypothetical protein